jgi:hypothetical protein
MTAASSIGRAVRTWLRKEREIARTTSPKIGRMADEADVLVGTIKEAALQCSPLKR